MKTFLMFLLISCGIAQNTTSQKQFIDTILFKSPSSETFSYFNSIDSSSKSTLFVKLSIVDTISDLSCKEICNSFSAQKAMYDSSRVPAGIATIYNQASSYIENNQLRDGVKVFYIAYAFKKYFIEQEKARLINNYHRTNYLIELESEDSLLSYIELFEKENMNSVPFTIVDQELKLKEFYQHIKETITEKTKIDIYERDHQDVFEPIFAVEIYSAGNFYSGRKSPTLLVTNYQTFEEELTTGYDYHQSFISFSPAIALSLKVFKNLRLSCCFSLNSFTIETSIKNFYSDEFIFYESNYLKVTAYQFEFLGKYLFRPYIGLRPFIESGIGVNTNHGEGKKLLAIYRYTFYSIEQTNSSFTIPFKAGVEYVYSKESPLYYTLSASGQYFLNNRDLIGKSSMQINIGLNIALDKI